MIISAFPACGKTYAFEHYQNKYIMLDSDSSEFSWISKYEFTDSYTGKTFAKKERNPEFPQNYIQHIKENMDDVDYLFVSSHKVVRDALKENNIPYILVYPERNALAEWVGRCYMRGNDKNFIDKLIEHWDEWITECDNEDGCIEKIQLKPTQYLWDVIHEKVNEYG